MEAPDLAKSSNGGLRENQITERKVPIGDRLWLAVKLHAQRRGVPYGKIVRIAVREWLERQAWNPLDGEVGAIEDADE